MGEIADKFDGDWPRHIVPIDEGDRAVLDRAHREIVPAGAGEVVAAGERRAPAAPIRRARQLDAVQDRCDVVDCELARCALAADLGEILTAIDDVDRTVMASKGDSSVARASVAADCADSPKPRPSTACCGKAAISATLPGPASVWSHVIRPLRSKSCQPSLVPT